MVDSRDESHDGAARGARPSANGLVSRRTIHECFESCPGRRVGRPGGFLSLSSCGGRDKKSRRTELRAGREDEPSGGGRRSLPAPRSPTARRSTGCSTPPAYENYVLRYLYDRLLDYDRNLEIVPVLAKDYEVSKDHLRITVTLRDSLRWHDGVPITAEDVKFTVDKILDPAVPAVNKEAWFSTPRPRRGPRPLTVVFVWKEPYAPSLHALTQFAPIPEAHLRPGGLQREPRQPCSRGERPVQVRGVADGSDDQLSFGTTTTTARRRTSTG